jgi:hypothetical protein
LALSTPRVREATRQVAFSNSSFVILRLTARAGNRRCGLLTALRANTNASYKKRFAMGNVKSA